jgi:hypothetical protein
MSGFEKFNMLASYASPPKAKRKRSTSKARSKNSSERNPKVQKSANHNTTLLPLKQHNTTQIDANLVTRSINALSRTNLEQKYDSPEKAILNNISCDEHAFNHPATSNRAQYSPNIDEDDSEPFQFTPDEEKLEKRPQSINARLLNLIQSFKSPSHMRYAKPGGVTEKFRTLLDKKKMENVKILGTTQNGQIESNERKIRITSLSFSTYEVIAKFEFLDDAENPLDDGKENFISLNKQIYGEVLKRHQKFIARIEYSLEAEKNVWMSYASHLRAF